MFGARKSNLDSARLVVKAGADVNAVGGDGKDALSLALFNGSYDVAAPLLDSHAKVNQADAQRFTPCSGQSIAATWRPHRISRGP
jgi:ankyrin repeat protein